MKAVIEFLGFSIRNSVLNFTISAIFLKLLEYKISNMRLFVSIRKKGKFISLQNIHFFPSCICFSRVLQRTNYWHNITEDRIGSSYMVSLFIPVAELFLQKKITGCTEATRRLCRYLIQNSMPNFVKVFCQTIKVFVMKRNN